MPMTEIRVLMVVIALLSTASCGPLIGAGAAVAADEVAEQDEGGDGLF
jgi:predicted small lipoprotein YifL